MRVALSRRIVQASGAYPPSASGSAPIHDRLGPRTVVALPTRQMYDGRALLPGNLTVTDRIMEAAPMLRRLALTTITALLALPLALTLAAEPAAAQKKTLVVALNQDPDILDPRDRKSVV